MISEKLRAAIKLNHKPAYKIAQKAGVDPSALSKLVCGIIKVKPGDPRLIRVGKVLGISADECFQEKIEEFN
jgi:transcriptional regulator with XRE-family HTH domain